MTLWFGVTIGLVGQLPAQAAIHSDRPYRPLIRLKVRAKPLDEMQRGMAAGQTAPGCHIVAKDRLQQGKRLPRLGVRIGCWPWQALHTPLRPCLRGSRA